MANGVRLQIRIKKKIERPEPLDQFKPKRSNKKVFMEKENLTRLITNSKLPRISNPHHLCFIIIGAGVLESIALYFLFDDQTIEQIGGVYQQFSLAILNLLFYASIYGETGVCFALGN